MHIQKLTIAPLVSGCQQTVIKRPSPDIAGLLIKEKLSSCYGYEQGKLTRVLRKMSKTLKGFINPEYKVVKERKFSL